ncbi:hypothetical protein [Pseudokordiimonas caeni]|uniref:hypothetical protein n=1 Tax=Pseudokordiimonas caeni TaxID=2997908 RepID=UPI0028120117|nr:hypothetical protein [Pseudokordiimonas caeni]
MADVLRDPALYFKAPIDVVRSPILSKDEKIRVLRTMEHDARDLAVATEENLGDGEQLDLHDILEALRELDPELVEESARHKGGSKLA